MIFVFDTHVHTGFSCDSNLEIEEVLDFLEKNQGKKVIITEHMDFKFPVKGLFIFDKDEFFEEYSKYRNENLLLGVELGLRTDCEYQAKKVLSDERFDYILGSVHTMDGTDIANGHFYDRYNEEELMVKYLETILNCINKYPEIDSLGHIDFITRYSAKEDSKFIIPETLQLIDSIVEKLVEKDICVEINTRRIHVENAYNELRHFLTLYKEKGGKYVTVGSDSHSDSALFSGFSTAKKLADEVNLQIVYYKKRKRIIDGW